MSNLLVVGSGKGFATELSKRDHNVLFTGDGGLKWNRASPISSRTLLIQAQTTLGSLDTAVLFFDTTEYNTIFDDVSIEEASKVADQLILGFQYFTLEFVNRVTQKEIPARLIFILRSFPSLSEIDHSTALKKQFTAGSLIPSSLFVSTAQSAFESFAQNISTFLLNNQFLSTLLITGDESNDVIKDDSSLADWLLDYIRTVEAAKNARGAIKSTFWVKAGSKPSSGFSLFKR